MTTPLMKLNVSQLTPKSLPPSIQ